MARVDADRELSGSFADNFLDPNQSEVKETVEQSDKINQQEADVYTYETGSLTNGLDILKTSDFILSASVFKTPNSKFQLTSMVLRHEYVVFETEYYWWSIEKSSDKNGAIIIQRSSAFDAVASKFRGKDRMLFWWKIGGLRCVKKHQLLPYSLTLLNLFTHLNNSNEALKSEHWVGSSSSNFASRVFSYLSQY
ncbi:uncharacterized protein LOC142335113 [Convolutriloba macropyga]|uniref:uncharacterized protein LOC142335113 n=1 Tax=Convolutriloba macropyga TaxID=536237 RepID=UPI003F51DF56